MAAYAHPEVLVDTSWVKGNIGNETVRIVEVDYDPTPNYNLGHIPGSVLIDWKKDINDPVRRDIVSKEGLEALFGRLGISHDHRIVLYGDFNNWFAAFAFWVFKYYGVDKVILLNGGRKKWIEQDLPVTKEVPSFPATTFTAKEPDETLRVYLAYVKEAYKQAGKVLVDVRGPKEFSGEILAPPEYPTEHAQRGGHIPGAKNIPWAQALRDLMTTRRSQVPISWEGGRGPGSPAGWSATVLVGYAYQAAYLDFSGNILEADLSSKADVPHAGGAEMIDRHYAPEAPI